MDLARTLTAAVSKDGEWYVARCLEVEVTSQGETVDEALANLRWSCTSKATRSRRPSPLLQQVPVR
jgi:hypothetical protein